MPTATRTYPYVELADKYALDVLAGRVPACRFVQLACERQRNDLAKYADPETAVYYFDEKAADRVCGIVSRFPHIKGIWASERKKLLLEPWQCFILSTVFGWKSTSTGRRRFKVAYIEIPRKNAKALALDTPIPTPDGWKTIGDIAAGDVIFDGAGLPTEVRATSEVFTNHECYRLNFSNGDSVIADAGHIWRTAARVNQVGIRAGREMGRRGGVSVLERERSTEEIFDTQTYGARGDRNHSLPLPPPLELSDAALDIDPYVLGAWLGDGTTAAAHITSGHQDVADTAYQIRSCGYDVACLPYGNAWRLTIRAIEVGMFGDMVVGKRSGRNFQYRLRNLGVLGDKHIPAAYLRGSVKQRLALLQGLMDTDGTISKSGLNLSFSTTNERLGRQVSELLATLGIKSSTKQFPLVCNGVPVPGIGYHIQFHAFREVPVFRLPRKLGRMRLRAETERRPRSQTVQITAVEKTAPVPVKCLTVASPTAMFLCGRTMLPTHNSTITSAVGNYMVACDGEAGAYVVSAANTRDQAKLVFVDSQIMARREEGFRSKFGVEVLAHVIAVPDTASKYEALSAEHSNLDGLNLHGALIDELHAHPTRGLWDVLETATGSRAQSLIWAITTAGVNRAGVCFDQRSHVIDVLNGHIEDDSYFGIIYTVDDGDDPWDEAIWAKANPNWGISIYPETIRSEAKRAQHMPSAQNAFFNKHLNIWTNADVAWLPAGSWDKCLDPKLDIEDFERQPCYLGIDLARRSDITAMMIVFPPADKREWWAVFGKYYLPEQTVSRAEHSHYQGWELAGRLVSTPGNVTDFDYIIANLADLAARYDVQEIVFDPFDAGPAVNAIQKEGIKKPIVDVRQSAANMSPAMVELEGLVLSKKIRHDGDPILAWMMANVRCRRTAGDLMQPDKENESKKIDGVTATLMCIHRALRRDRPAAARVQILSMEDDE